MCSCINNGRYSQCCGRRATTGIDWMDREPATFAATLVVTFMDGKVLSFPGIRVLAKKGFKDPIEVNGTTIVCEDSEQSYTLLGVRYFTMDV